MQPPRNLRDDALTIWKAGVAAVDGRTLVRDFVSVEGDALKIGDRKFPISGLERIVLVGFGKACGAMAVGFEQALGEAFPKQISVVGQINVPNDQMAETRFVQVVGCRPPGENLPTDRVLAATERIIELINSAGPNEICVCLISGGGSALLEKPLESVTLDEFRAATSCLSSSGASIFELNTVRRVISQVKGGGLASFSGGAPIISLIVSDVVGDNLDVIASGPTFEPTHDLPAIAVLEKFDPDRTGVPKSVWEAVAADSRDQMTPAKHSINSHFVIGNVETAMQAAAEKAVELGYRVELFQPSGNEGDAETVGRSVAIQIAHASEKQMPACKLMGGETTVALCHNPGRGGRNQHLVSSALEGLMNFHLRPDAEYCLLSAGTDGEDGNVPVAGAVFDSRWIDSISEMDRPGLLEELRRAIENCDSHTFLSKWKLLVKVPRTFTNVCDLRVLLSNTR